ncbi:MAG: RecX family transcriptional regulator [Clostridia bacterium]|nr:RecX family transcriptional regulator [Clostridia bacterium]
MEITDIRPVRKRLSMVYIDGEPAMKLDTFTLEAEGVRPGMHITDEDLQELVQKSNAHRAGEKALYLLEYRSRTKKELTDRLREEVPAELAEATAQRMEDLGLVNDEAYAADYARMLATRKQFAPRRIRQELAAKGIDKDTAEAAAAEVWQDPREVIADFLDRRFPVIADEKTRRRAVAALQRMGYGYDDIRAVLRDRAEEAEEE